MKMTKNKKLIIILSAAALILFIYFLKFAGSFGINTKITGTIRSFTYIFMFCTWGMSLKTRITQNRPRKYLLIVAFFIVFWFVVRTLKYDYIPIELYPNFYRRLWYMYYIAILFIPMFSVFASMYIGKPENYRLPKKAALMYIPTVFLAVAVVTNDFHQMAFDFVDDNIVWSDKDYTYGWVYYAIVVWVIFCILLMFFELFTKRRREKNFRLLLVSGVPLVLVAVYVFLYCIGVGWLKLLFSDMTLVTCILCVVYFEISINLGFIQVNTSYKTLLSNAADISVQITDNDYTVRYVSKYTKDISLEQMKAAEVSPVEFSDGTRLHNMSIHGGHTVWIEDMSELIKLRDKLEVMREESNDRNALLQLEYEREKEHKAVEEQNRLYDLLQNHTQIQIDKIRFLSQQYRNTSDNDEKKQILMKIAVFGSFIKRRKDLVLCIDSTPTVPESKLKGAFGESYRSLKLMNVDGTYYVNTGNEYCNGEVLASAYDFFEEVLEIALDNLKSIDVRVVRVKEKIRISIFVDGECDFSSLENTFPEASVYSENSQSDIVLTLCGGDLP